MRTMIAPFFAGVFAFFLICGGTANSQKKHENWPKIVDLAIADAKTGRSNRKSTTAHANKIAQFLSSKKYRHLLPQLRSKGSKLIHARQVVSVAIATKSVTRHTDPFGSDDSKITVNTTTYANVVRQQSKWQLAGLRSVDQGSTDFVSVPYVGKNKTSIIDAIQKRVWVTNTPQFLVSSTSTSYLLNDQSSLKKWNGKSNQIVQHRWSVIELPIRLKWPSHRAYLFVKSAGAKIALEIKILPKIYVDPFNETKLENHGPEDKETLALIRKMFLHRENTTSVYRQLLRKNRPELIAPALAAALKFGWRPELKDLMVKLAGQQGKFGKALLWDLFLSLDAKEEDPKAFKNICDAIKKINASMDQPLSIIAELDKTDSFWIFKRWTESALYESSIQFEMENKRFPEWFELQFMGCDFINSLKTPRQTIQRFIDYLPERVLEDWKEIRFLTGINEAQILDAIKVSIAKGTTRSLESALRVFDQLTTKLDSETKHKMLGECYFGLIEQRVFETATSVRQRQVISHLSVTDLTDAQVKELISALKRMVDISEKPNKTIKKPIRVSADALEEAKLALIDLE